MSKKDVEKFYAALANDAELQEKVTKSVAGPVANNLIVSLAKEAGYEFTEADLKEYAENREEGKVMMPGDWACNCIVGGSGYYKGTCQCVCVLGGGGKADPDGYYLYCVAAGTVTKF